MDLTTAAGTGNAAVLAVVAAREQDGMNPLRDEPERGPWKRVYHAVFYANDTSHPAYSTPSQPAF